MNKLEFSPFPLVQDEARLWNDTYKKIQVELFQGEAKAVLKLWPTNLEGHRKDTPPKEFCHAADKLKSKMAAFIQETEAWPVDQKTEVVGDILKITEQLHGNHNHSDRVSHLINEFSQNEEIKSILGSYSEEMPWKQMANVAPWLTLADITVPTSVMTDKSRPSSDYQKMHLETRAETAAAKFLDLKLGDFLAANLIQETNAIDLTKVRKRTGAQLLYMIDRLAELRMNPAFQKRLEAWDNDEHTINTEKIFTQLSKNVQREYGPIIDRKLFEAIKEIVSTGLFDKALFKAPVQETMNVTLQDIIDVPTITPSSTFDNKVTIETHSKVYFRQPTDLSTETYSSRVFSDSTATSTKENLSLKKSYTSRINDIKHYKNDLINAIFKKRQDKKSSIKSDHPDNQQPQGWQPEDFAKVAVSLPSPTNKFLAQNAREEEQFLGTPIYKNPHTGDTFVLRLLKKNRIPKVVRITKLQLGNVDLALDKPAKIVCVSTTSAQRKKKVGWVKGN